MQGRVIYWVSYFFLLFLLFKVKLKKMNQKNCCSITVPKNWRQFNFQNEFAIKNKCFAINALLKHFYL